MAADQLEIRRILVALDASPSSLSALHSAVELAAGLEAELIGLYVEDTNLLRLAQLPFAREVSAFSATLRRLEALELERQLKTQAERMRQILSRLCAEQGVSWQFQVSRGAVGAEILAAAVNADLMVIGKIGRSFPGTRRTGSITRLIVSQRPGMTLILQTGTLLSYPVILLYDGSEQAKKALNAVGHLAKAHDGRLTVLIVADSKDQARRLEMDVIQQLQEYELGADFRLLVRYTLEQIARQIRREGSGPVVIPCEPDVDDKEPLSSLIDEVTNPVLLVR
jgi:nucleotide-binding universal stress UspA family protein